MRFVDTPCLNILSYKRTSKSRIEEKLIEFNYLIETSRLSSKRRTNRVVATIINRPLSLSLSLREESCNKIPASLRKKKEKTAPPLFQPEILRNRLASRRTRRTRCWAWLGDRLTDLLHVSYLEKERNGPARSETSNEQKFSKSRSTRRLDWSSKSLVKFESRASSLK